MTLMSCRQASLAVFLTRSRLLICVCFFLLGGDEGSVGLFAFLAGVGSRDGMGMVLSPLVPVLMLELNNLLTVYGLLG